MTTPLCRPLAAFGYLYLAAQALGVWPGELLGSPLEPGERGDSKPRQRRREWRVRQRQEHPWHCLNSRHITATPGPWHFSLIPTAQLCGASLGWCQTGGSPRARLSSLPPGPTLTTVTAFLPHLSGTTNVTPPLSVSGKCTPPSPGRMEGAGIGAQTLWVPLGSGVLAPREETLTTPTPPPSPQLGPKEQPGALEPPEPQRPIQVPCSFH